MDVIVRMIDLCLLATLSTLSGAYAYEQCSYWPDYKYCDDGYYCCNDNTQCCSTLTIGAIIGIVIGCILFISCVIAVICCVTKQSHRPGQVVHPQQHGVTVVSTGIPQGQPPGYGQPMYGQPMYGQPVYGQASHGQQQYGFQPPPGDKAGTSDPAFPPPASNY